MILELIGFGATVGATLGGHVGARRFVRERLRFVNAVHQRRAPWIAGAVAALVAVPVAWALPLVWTGTAVLFGIGVGTGVAIGARDLRRDDAHYLGAG